MATTPSTPSRRRIDAIDALSDQFPRRWDTAAEGARGKKARQETLKRVLKNAKTFVRDLSSEVLRAKELWAEDDFAADAELCYACLLYTSPSPRDQRGSRMPSSA